MFHHLNKGIVLLTVSGDFSTLVIIYWNLSGSLLSFFFPSSFSFSFKFSHLVLHLKAEYTGYFSVQGLGFNLPLNACFIWELKNNISCLKNWEPYNLLWKKKKCYPCPSWSCTEHTIWDHAAFSSMLNVLHLSGCFWPAPAIKSALPVLLCTLATLVFEIFAFTVQEYHNYLRQSCILANMLL